MFCLRDIFETVTQHFLQLLAGSETSENNLNVFVWLQSAQPDHLNSEIDNFYRFSHIQHEDVAALSQCEGFQNQAHRFGNSHEKTRDLGMRYCHRTASGDLLGEGWDYAAGRAEHVSKADGGKLRCVRASHERLQINLRSPFHWSYNSARFDCF